MNSESPAGPKKWTECSYCGHWFAQALAICPKCNKPNDNNGPEPFDPTPVDAERAGLITAGFVVRCLFIVLLVFLVAIFLPSGHSASERFVTFVGVIIFLYIIRRMYIKVLRNMGLVPEKKEDEKIK